MYSEMNILNVVLAQQCIFNQYVLVSRWYLTQIYFSMSKSQGRYHFFVFLNFYLSLMCNVWFTLFVKYNTVQHGIDLSHENTKDIIAG